MSRVIPEYLPPLERQRIYVDAINGQDPGPYPDLHGERACRVVAEDIVCNGDGRDATLNNRIVEVTRNGGGSDAEP